MLLDQKKLSQNVASIDRFAMRRMETRPIFAIANPNREWVAKELDSLREEWSNWLEVARNLPDSPDYDPQTCSEAIKDGFDNLRKHAVLREKTLVFIGNHFSGYEFLFENWPDPPYEDNLSRLKEIIPTWLHRLDTIKASINYARVPDGFWTSKGKKLVEKIVELGPDKGAELATSWLKNPMQ